MTDGDGATEICAIDGAAYRNRGKGGCPVCEVREHGFALKARVEVLEGRPADFRGSKITIHQTFANADPDRVAQRLVTEIQEGGRIEEPPAHADPFVASVLADRAVMLGEHDERGTPGIGTGPQRGSGGAPDPWGNHRILQLRRQLSALVLAVSGKDIYMDGISEEDFEVVIETAKGHAHAAMVASTTTVSRDRFVAEQKAREQAEGALALSRTSERNARNEMGALLANLEAIMAKLREPRG